MSSNLDTTLAFIESWRTRDLDRILSFMSEDCFYHNIPMQPMRGHEEIRAGLTDIVNQATDIEWVVHHAAESASGVVLTERSDRFLVKGQWLDMPVMGTFELQDGKITAWRDYFDLGQFHSEMAKVADPSEISS